MNQLEKVNTAAFKKAINLAQYVHCSPHEWPEGKEVAEVCQALLDANEAVDALIKERKPILPDWVTPDDVNNSIKAFEKYDTKKLSLHNWRTMVVCMKACRHFLPTEVRKS